MAHVNSIILLLLQLLLLIAVEDSGVSGMDDIGGGWTFLNVSYSAFGQSVLKRQRISDWDREYAFNNQEGSPKEPLMPCSSLQILPWGSSVSATSFCYNGLVSFEVCRR